MAEGTNEGLSILDRIKQFDSSPQSTQPVNQVKPKKPSLKKRTGQKAHIISSHGHITKSKPPPLTRKISSHRLALVENCVTSPKSKNADFSSRLPTSPSKPTQQNKPALKPPVANRNKPLRPMRSLDDNSKPSPPKESTPKSVAQRWKQLEQSTSSKEVSKTPEKVQVKKLPSVVNSTSAEVVQPDIQAPKSFLHQNRPSRKSRSGSRKSPTVKPRPLLPSDGRDKITAVTVQEEDWDEEEYEDVLLPPRKVQSEEKANDSDSWETDDDDDYLHEYHDIYEPIAFSPPKSTVVPKPTLPPPPVPSKPVRNRLARNSAASEDTPSGEVNTVPKPPRTTGKNIARSPNPPDRIASLVDTEEATSRPKTVPRNVPQIKLDAKNKKIPPVLQVEGSSPQTKGKHKGVKLFLHNMLAKSKSGGDLTVPQPSLNPSSCPDTLSPLASAALEGRNWKSLEKLGDKREEYEDMASTKNGSTGVPRLPHRDDRPPATLPRRDLTEHQWPSMEDSTYMISDEYLDIVEFPANPNGGDDEDLYVLPDDGDDEVYEDVLVSKVSFH
ncbi:proteoglycan 4-like [Branchiostoma floridae]|uniref:Proteoglycan 4-like n=1 Tax=Branchiostoma floridae TaxID=7739 RepID=A0A9J7M932_BRAFL|nr:proteoglycan 4-like [Branchiostoma floridae]